MCMTSEKRGLGSTFIPRRDSEKILSLSLEKPEGQRPMYVRLECVIILLVAIQTSTKTKVQLDLHQCGDLCEKLEMLDEPDEALTSQKLILDSFIFII